MKILINAIFILGISLLYEDNAFSMTDYQIKKICRNAKRKSDCIEELKDKRLDLIQGKKIEIPVIPFKK